ncbi:MAG TPA: GMC family oxidoreductase [Longimicrobiaceae bacterium]
MIYLQREEYDAVVVGSGVSGGWAAKELTEKGLRTLVLERGREVEHQKDYVTEHVPPWDMPHRNRRITGEMFPEQAVQIRGNTVDSGNRHFYQNDTQHPYREQAPFTWVQADVVGGRSLLWGRQCYRWSDLDFEANLRDGNGVDWPIRYADIAPWYSYVERHVGISGEKLGLPQLPDGDFQPPMEMNAGEKFVKAGIEGRFPGRNVTIGRSAVLTQALGDRAACHYCGECSRGCSTGSYFSSQSSTLPPARATGRLTLRPHSLAHSLIFDEQQDRVTGVRFVDTTTGDLHEVFAKVVFLCASTLGSTRVLLNSKTGRHPNGLGGNSNALGRNLMDHHFRVGARGDIPGLLDRYYQGRRPNGIYIPRFRNLEGPGSDNLGYVRGFGYQGSASRSGWNRGATAPEIGTDLKQILHEPGPWAFNIGSWGECLPRPDNTALLSEETDQWGIPLLTINCTWGPNEFAMRRDMAQQAAEMLEAAGLENVATFDNHEDGTYGAEPGLCIHEMGTARMGRDPATSVLNGNNQLWDSPNVYVTDGACMASSSCVNPSVTYMALTARAADHAVNELKRQNI